MDKYKKIRKATKPRKILKVNSSKYERSKAMQDSKIYWNNRFNNLPGTSEEQVSEIGLSYPLLFLLLLLFLGNTCIITLFIYCRQRSVHIVSSDSKHMIYLIMSVQCA